MATQLGNFDGAGVGHNLAAFGTYLVAEGVRIYSTDNTGVAFDAPDNTIAQRFNLTIAGLVQGGDTYAAVEITGEPSSERDSAFISVTRTGVISTEGSGSGIYASDFDGRIVIQNAGLISGGRGMVLYGEGVKTVTNSGLIFGESIAITASEGPIILRNSGQIITRAGNGGTSLDFTGTANGGTNDQVFNSGLISGDADLGYGNDLYDGRGGKMIGELNGGLGNDRFIPGAARDSIVGGDGEDVLDFRSSRGVNVALDGSFTNTGAARGDTYAEIENIRGSLKGADKLRGDAQSNDLFGYGGADTLVGAAGNDRLNGGLGRDRLSGGDGSDVFVFNSLREGGDVITDFAGGFSVNKDSFFINLKGFGLAGSTFKQGWYREGSSNVARDRDDHFIFRKTDTTLWFDADGRGGRGPVLLANLQAGAELDWTQFNNIT